MVGHYHFESERAHVSVADHTTLTYHAVPVDGFQLDVTISGGGPVHVRVEDRSNGLPAIRGLQITRRPPDTMLAPFEMADPTVVTSSFSLQ